jgi:hypothetical protein
LHYFLVKTSRTAVTSTGSTTVAGEDDPTAWATAISVAFIVFCLRQRYPIYSLIALPTAGILMGAVYERVHEAKTRLRENRTAFRLLACIPPAFGAPVIVGFQRRAKYTGIFMIRFTVCPALLLSSRYCMKKKDLPVTTYYSSHFRRACGPMVYCFFPRGDW